MEKTSVEQRQELFKQDGESGLLASEFYKAKNLHPHYFSKRRKILG